MCSVPFDAILVVAYELAGVQKSCQQSSGSEYCTTEIGILRIWQLWGVHQWHQCNVSWLQEIL